MIGTQIYSIARPINGLPSNTDYYKYTITPPSGIKWSSGKIKFNSNDEADYLWTLTEKGKYLVEVRAYYEDGTNVPVKAPTTSGGNVIMHSMQNGINGCVTSQTIPVE
ncbi:MAG: hypothetical protein LBT66_08815 [Methanobrevibacter sp.]|jgi:hypothetical protein|nr:hypothetical protein [Candidatus Methanovirga meridionalis]